MSNTTKIFLLVVSGLLLFFAYWYYFSVSGQMWRINQEIERSWKNTEIYRNNQAKEEEDFSKTVFNEAKTINETKVLTSGSRNPIILEGKRNYVTGDNLTYIVPESMKRLLLIIQDHLGRNIDSYSLPNTFINIKPKQRITLEVKK